MPQDPPPDDRSTHHPVIVDTEPVDLTRVWKDCANAADKVVRQDGTVNYRAAACADPGVCACPACGRYHWSIGFWHQCTRCGFVYPTNAWAMFSWGCAAGAHASCCAGSSQLATQRMAHPYYRYGFEHHSESTPDTRWEHFHRISWEAVMKDVPQPTHLRII
ncbi:MAG: hypothetical protein BWY85_00047 [Firmicutes bacterium ADurb.Bin506]|nr:MAG: hypothetical protein BWY85_00047 [Firmicutes bacterium ADurb.Bin506]